MIWLMRRLRLDGPRVHGAVAAAAAVLVQVQALVSASVLVVLLPEPGLGQQGRPVLVPMWQWSEQREPPVPELASW